MPKTIRVGIYLPVYGGWLRGVEEEEEPPTYDYVKRVAIEAEKVGIDSLWIPDHMLNPIKGERAPCLEAWTVAAAIAEATDRVIISHTTLCEAFRNPAVLAKQATTLTEISRGRFWLSIGAGWFRREYEAHGLPFYEHDDRVDRAREAIQIIKRLWEEDEVTYEGKYYSIYNGILEPKPRPKPPVWYAGMSDASRNLVASEADGWLMGRCSLEDASKNVQDMLERLRKRGRGRIEFAIPAFVFIRRTDEEAREHVNRLARGKSGLVKRIIDTGLVGSPEIVAERVGLLERAGINHVLLQLTPTLRELHWVSEALDIIRKMR